MIFTFSIIYVNSILLIGLCLFDSKLCNQLLPYTMMFWAVAMPLIYIDILKLCRKK